MNLHDGKLYDLLSFVTKHVPFYKRFSPLLSGNLEPGEILQRFPIIDKSIIKGNAASFLSDEVRDFEIAQTASLHSIIPGQQLNKMLVPEVTSGSSGFPLICYKRNSERIRLGLSIWKRRKMLDPLVSQKSLYCLIHAHVSQKKVVDDTRNFHPENIKKVLSYLIKEFRPRIVHGTPSDLFEYAKYILQQDVDLEGWSPS
ncbi:MAG: hypothetical protein ABIO55_06555, partial [Ginsengibacter sp.]